jgi:hypothetical protein
MERPVPPAEPDTFRRLVEREITTEEYVRSLDERVKELREPHPPSNLPPHSSASAHRDEPGGRQLGDVPQVLPNG